MEVSILHAVFLVSTSKNNGFTPFTIKVNEIKSTTEVFVNWPLKMFSEALGRKFLLYKDGSVAFKERAVRKGGYRTIIMTKYTKKEIGVLCKFKKAGMSNIDLIKLHLVKETLGGTRIKDFVCKIAEGFEKGKAKNGTSKRRDRYLFND